MECSRAVRWFARSLLSFALGSALAGCVGDHGKRRYEFVVRVHSDPGVPLAGARVSIGDKLLGTSGSDGKVLLGAHALEGESLSLSIRCPEGHRSPPKPLNVVLRRTVDTSVRPEFEASCPPEKRTLVVAVRAENGPGLPIRHLGRELGRTDEAGAAHVLLETTSEEAVELTLDTTSHPRLRPSNPSARFRLDRRDEVVAFTQRFESPKSAPGSGRTRSRRGPVRISTE